MVISNKMHRIIRDLAELSSTAKHAADRIDISLSTTSEYGRLFPSTGPSLSGEGDSIPLEDPAQQITALKEQVEQLNEQVASLVSAIEEEHESKFDDAQSYAFTEAFRVTLKNLSYSTACLVYNRLYFIEYPKNVRVLIANALDTNFMDKAPNSLWKSILTTCGSL